MKLELKHLEPYLLYELKVQTEHIEGNRVYTLEGLSIKYDRVDLDDDYGWSYIGGIKPILRPLSEFGDSDDTRKVHEFIGLGKWCDNYTEYFNTWFDDLANIDKLILQAPKEVFDYFLANHFDVFNLIENNLAIDINTIK